MGGKQARDRLSRRADEQADSTLPSQTHDPDPPFVKLPVREWSGKSSEHA
jgi:hypothetical protein